MESCAVALHQDVAEGTVGVRGVEGSCTWAPGSARFRCPEHFLHGAVSIASAPAPMSEATHQIFKIRRDYNTWVANETLEDYALRYTFHSQGPR